MTQISQLNELAVTQSSPPSDTLESPYEVVYRTYLEQLQATHQQVEASVDDVQSNLDRVRYLQKILGEINTQTDSSYGVDLTQGSLKDAICWAQKELGLQWNIEESTSTLSALQKDRLIENINLLIDEFNKENQKSTREMEKGARKLERILILIHEFNKMYNSYARTVAHNMR